MTQRLLLSLLLALAITSCSQPSRKGGYYQDDGPPDRAVDLSNVPDAVPRSEPLSATGNKPYVVFGKSYAPLASARGFRQRGVASWYGKQFHGRRTSSGETYDMYAMSAAHTVLPIPSYARVTNLGNGRSVVVRVNDRGPFKSSRVMDLSYAAAYRLGMIADGTALVEISAIDPSARQAPPAATAVKTEGAGLYIQVGAFANRQSASRLQGELHRQGYDDAFISNARRGQTSLFRVRLGPLNSVEYADARLARLQETGFADAHYVVEDRRSSVNRQ
jgi:rare lipoprotein A